MLGPVAVLTPSPGGFEQNLCTVAGPAVLNDPPLGRASLEAAAETIPIGNGGGRGGGGEEDRQRPGETLEDVARQCGVAVPPACKLLR